MGVWGESRETREVSRFSESENDSFIEPSELVDVNGRFYLKQIRFRLVTQRVFGLFIVILSLVVAVPAFLVIAALIKLDSPGPIFFKQERMGMDRQRFSIWKFRKMHEGLKSAEPKVIVRHDRRLTRRNGLVPELVSRSGCQPHDRPTAVFPIHNRLSGVDR